MLIRSPRTRLAVGMLARMQRDLYSFATGAAIVPTVGATYRATDAMLYQDVAGADTVFAGWDLARLYGRRDRSGNKLI
jgi:hypothetical protein